MTPPASGGRRAVAPAAVLAILAIVVVGVGLAACRPDGSGPGLDPDRERAHVAALVALGPRPADTPASRAAAALIEHELAGIPLEILPVGDVDLPALAIGDDVIRPARHVHVDDPDLIARFGPPGKALLVMAHYDSVPASPGAVDNAAAVAVLIELAHQLRIDPPAQPVMLAFTADEERGLVGAEALARRHGDEVELAIALDLIGGSGRLSLNGASARIGYAELRWLARAARRAGVVVDAPLPHRVMSRWFPQAERADHGAFTRAGIRAFHLYHRGQDGLWIDPAYHGPRDTPTRVHPEALAEISRLLRALVAEPVPRPGGDGFWLPVAVDTVVPRGWLVGFDVGLAVIALVGLAGLRVGGDRARPRGPGLIAGALCFAVAAVVAMLADHPISIDPAQVSLAPFARSAGGAALVIAGGLGLATRIVARRFAWAGGRRYLAVAILWPAAIGGALLALDAAELAWIWLAPAAALALAPRWPRPVAALAAAASLGPAVAIINPQQLLEARWHMVWLPGVPLAGLVAVLVLPSAAAAAWWSRSRATGGPLGTLGLALGCAASALAGIALQLSV